MKLSLTVVTFFAVLAICYLSPPVESRVISRRWPCWWGLGPEIPPSWLRNARRNDSSPSESSNGSDDIVRHFDLLPMIVPDWLCDLRYNGSLPQLNATDSNGSE
ncbi:uncharacterized protein LOC109399273 [Aedes albopictus]|uniref:W-rich salivary secreted peptide n=1 Tax=Aedes albopictus TaxID=7160 RepID=A0ABM1Z860_AEDAL